MVGQRRLGNAVVAHLLRLARRAQGLDCLVLGDGGAAGDEFQCLGNIHGVPPLIPSCGSMVPAGVNRRAGEKRAVNLLGARRPQRRTGASGQGAPRHS